MLIPQDCVVLVKLVANPDRDWPQRQLSMELGISLYEINSSLKRLLQSKLLRRDESQQAKFFPVLAAVEEFLIHGVKYSFPVKLGEYTLGTPTSVAAPILKNKVLLGEGLVPVWPYGLGNVKGLALKPLYSSIPQALSEYPDKKFYDLLALIDAIRQGRAREQKIAIKMIKEQLI